MQPQKLGDYVLEELLGSGGMAEVFVARRNGPHGFCKRVAIKRVLPQLANDPRLVAMLCDEARVQAALGHPNLVQVFDFGEEGGQPFIALELVEGLSAAQLISRVAARRRTVDLGPALYIAREVLAALAYVHAATDEQGESLGIVHRDVTPSNILIGRMGQVKLGDFGIVRSTMIDSRTVPGELKGKVGYVSPEQALGMPLDGRSDLFSLGVVLAELLMCAPLFTGKSEIEVLQSLNRGDLSTLATHGSHVPDDVRQVLTKALARWPEQRYQTAGELARDIEGLAQAHGQTLGAHEMAEWLADLGLIAVSSDVRQRPASPIPLGLAARRPISSDSPFAESVTLMAGESDRPSPPSEPLLSRFPKSDIPTELSHAVSAPNSSRSGTS
jgi:serine/threonine-protein kinase